MPRCSCCHLELPSTFFSIDNSRSDTRYPYCKAYAREKMATYVARPKSLPSPGVLRICSKCHIPQPLVEFYVDASKHDGYALQCKTCKRATVKKYRTDNPEKIHASKRAWKVTDQGRDAGRRHYHAHRDIYIKKSRERYRKNPALSSEKQRAWRIKNPAKAQIIIDRANTKRQELYQNAPLNNFTYGQFPTILAMHHYVCFWCGFPSNRLEQDHIIPLSRGGPHTASNIVPACRSCNASKNDKMPWEWITP